VRALDGEIPCRLAPRGPLSDKMQAATTTALMITGVMSTAAAVTMDVYKLAG
jgi:hypothetical protein